MDDDDYEKANAREWDLNYQPSAKSETAPSETAKQAAGKRKQRGKQRAQPNEPSALNTGVEQRQPVTIAQPAWLDDRSARRRKQGRQEPQTLLIDLGDDVQNTAEAAWRELERPTATISIPDELVWLDQQHEAIARRNGTFIFTQDRRGSGGEVRFDIWGEPQAVHHTKQAIHDWIQRETPSKRAQGKSAFYKSGSLLPQQRKNEEKKWAREVKRQRFRQRPPLGTKFGAIGTFHWPVQDYQPHEVLGTFCEALDPIRMDCSCYVVFYPETQLFQAMGDADAVKTALLRIRKTFFQVAARQIAPIRRYILCFTKDDGQVDVPSSVSLRQFSRIRRIRTNAQVNQGEIAKSPCGIGERAFGVLKEQVLTTSTRDLSVAGKSILLMIRKLHYYRGHLKFRIRLGTFLATHYKATEDGSFAIDDFQDMLQQSQFAGEMTTEVGDQYSETTALQALQSEQDLLFPRDNMINTLLEVKPVYTAILTFAEKAGDLQLEVSWHPVDDDGQVILEQASKRWTRLDRGTTHASSLIDINLLNLKNGTAWQFDMTASQVVEENRLPPELQRLTDTIRIDDLAAQQQRMDKPFLRWNPNASVRQLQQRTTYQFGIANSDFYVELSRFQDRVFAPRSRMPGDADCQVYEPRWSLEVFHNTWNKLLARNEHITVGQAADWEDDVKTWFPEDDIPGDFEQVKGEKGFEQLLAKLALIEKVMFRAESEMFESFGAMEIG